MKLVNGSCRVGVAALVSAVGVAGLSGSALGQYCTPSSTYPTYEYIGHTQIAGLNHSLTGPPAGGYLDSTSLSTDLDRAASYGLTVGIGNNYTGDQCAVWFDWDHDGVFSAAERTLVGSNFGPYNVTIPVPATAATGPTRMRVRVTWQQDPQPCGNSDYGSTTDYTVNVVAPASTPPTCNLALSPTTGLMGQTFTASATVYPGSGPVSTGLAVSLDAGSVNGGTVTLYDNGTHGDPTAGDGVYTGVVTVGSGTPDGPHTLTATVSDAQGRSSTDQEVYTSGYCSVQITSVVVCDSFYEYIQNVAFGSINNSSQCDSGLYEDYSAISTDLPVGVPTPMAVSIANQYNGDKVKVWIDFNNNASFMDPGEEFTMDPYPAPTGTPVVNGMITAPLGTAPGPKRMRIRLHWGSPAHLPCGSTLYGNVEDYTVNVVPGCGSADFDCDGDVGTDADIESFFACLGGNCPAAPCTSNADFNADGDVGTDADIEAFFRVLGGGPC